MSKPRRLITVQDNELINSPYVLSLNEKRLMNLVISKINPLTLPRTNETFVVCISAHEWRELYGTNSKSLDDDLFNACARLTDRPALRIPNGTDRPALAPWVSYARPNAAQGTITIKLVYELLLYLKGFVDQFTQYDLLNVRKIRSFYSIRVYELLCQYKKMGKRKFKLDDFRAVIDPDNKYPRWPDLRRYVVEKAVLDINNETDLTVAWKQTNPGRKVSEITFSIKTKSKAKLALV
jgi:plasmid replication initiation protein